MQIYSPLFESDNISYSDYMRFKTESKKLSNSDQYILNYLFAVTDHLYMELNNIFISRDTKAMSGLACNVFYSVSGTITGAIWGAAFGGPAGFVVGLAWGIASTAVAYEEC